MNGQYYSRPYRSNMEGSGFYNPMMKYPDFGQGMQQLIQNLVMMRQIKQEQEERKQQNEQQQWQRGMTEESAEREKERLRLAQTESEQQTRIREEQLKDIQLGRFERKQERAQKAFWAGKYPVLEIYNALDITPSPETIEGITGMRKAHPQAIVQRVQRRLGITPEEWANMPSADRSTYIQDELVTGRQRTPDYASELRDVNDRYGRIKMELQVGAREKLSQSPLLMIPPKDEKDRAAQDAIRQQLISTEQEILDIIEEQRTEEINRLNQQFGRPQISMPKPQPEPTEAVSGLPAGAKPVGTDEQGRTIYQLLDGRKIVWEEEPEEKETKASLISKLPPGYRKYIPHLIAYDAIRQAIEKIKKRK